jgi:hypothetical protein
LRRRVIKYAPHDQQDVLKCCRHLILKNRENLDGHTREREAVFAEHAPDKGEILKESLRQNKWQDTIEQGRGCLEEWSAQAGASNIP